MKALARSVIEAALFLETSGDDVVDPDTAVRALEGIAHELASTSEAERLALREVLDELIPEEQSGPDASASRAEAVAFYRSFMENFGLQGE
jgi:hypothetical protein